MLRRMGKAVRAHPKTALALTILALIGIAAGCYGRVLYQWQAARTALKEGRNAEALSRLDLCLLVWPNSMEVHLLAAKAARLKGDFDIAESHLNRCLKLADEPKKKDVVQLEFLLMRVQMGEVDEVARDLLKCVENKHADSALILETLSRAYMFNLRYRPAFSCLNQWIKLAPESALPYYWRGWVMERLSDNPAEALKDYIQALDLNPDLVPVRLRVAEIFLERSRLPEALPHLEQLYKQYPDRPDVQARMGQCRFLQGEVQEARRLLEAAVEKLPDDAPLLLYLAKLELHDDRPAKAEEFLRKVLKADPADREAQHVLVSALQIQGRREEAQAALLQYGKQKALLEKSTRLLRDEAERPTKDAAAAFAIGDILLQVGQERLALYWLNQALRRDSNFQPAHKALADFYQSKGEQEKSEFHRRRLRNQDADAKSRKNTAPVP